MNKDFPVSIGSIEPFKKRLETFVYTEGELRIIPINAKHKFTVTTADGLEYDFILTKWDYPAYEGSCKNWVIYSVSTGYPISSHAAETDSNTKSNAIKHARWYQIPNMEAECARVKKECTFKKIHGDHRILTPETPNLLLGL